MKRILIYSLLAVVVSTSSCNKEFLELRPQQSIKNVDFFKSLGDFESAITGAYDQVQNSDWYGRYMLLVPDVMGEDVKQNASANRAKEWAEYNGAPVDFIPEEFWAEIYEGINISNAIINAEFTPAAVVQAEYDQIIGEAYTIRALGHFDLVRLFAQHYTYTNDASHLGIPIVTEFDLAALPARNTVAEVYTQIISDLQMGISLMSIDNGSGRISEAAAQALLSRVYLYMEDWANAEAQADAVINSGNYSLVDAADYPTMFLDGSSSEAIFEVVYNLVDNPGSDHIGGMYKETGYGDYLPATDLLDLMDDTDIRKSMFLTDNNLGGAYGNLRVNKYPSEGSDIGTDNVPVIRLAEVYLNRAEARAQQGDNPGAQADLDMVRQRSWAAAPAASATGQALVDEILIERRIELAFEGHSIFDVTRNKRDVVRDDCTAPAGACSLTYPNDRFILPIPIEETDVNPNITQNPSYGS